MLRQIYRLFITAIFGVISYMPFLTTAQSPTEGDQLYVATTLRAAPGKLIETIQIIQLSQSKFPRDKEPIAMRHSQGDHWDILLLAPIDSVNEIIDQEGSFYKLLAELEPVVHFREDLIAKGPAFNLVKSEFRRNNLFHIEMFDAVAGKKEKLLHQRRIENKYLEKAGLETNLIWAGIFGSDVDVFTIGFHESLSSFAADPNVSAEQADAIAIEVGFKGRAFIGTYLRELLVSHHDTLATPVR